MNAKETIKKIADALNIKSDASQEAAKEVVETKEETPVLETTETKVEDSKPEAKEESKVEDTKEADGELTVSDADKAEPTPEVAEVKVEETKESQEDVKSEESIKVDPKVAELENQLAEMQKLLDAAVKVDKAPEVEPEVKPLTHSPETAPATNRKKIGGHGGDILDRVYKYIN